LQPDERGERLLGGPTRGAAAPNDFGNRVRFGQARGRVGGHDIHPPLDRGEHVLQAGKRRLLRLRAAGQQRPALERGAQLLRLRGVETTGEILEGIVQIAIEHGLVILADEIYDKILYDDAKHVALASISHEPLCITFNGLSKTYRLAGFRSGWMIISGAKHKARDFIEGLDILSTMRLCANVPAQHAIQTALGGYQSINDLVLPGGRLREQRDKAWEMINAIPGVSCTKPKGAIYMFPRLDPKVHRILDDEKMIFDLLTQEKMLLVQGTAFNYPDPDHFRIVTLPLVADLEEAIGRLGRFLQTYSQV